MSRVEAVVVGRRAELDAVEHFLAEAPGRVRALSITGPAGVGKTTVWRAGAEHAAAAGWRVLTARPAGVEASLSFAALGDLLGAVDDTVLAELPAPQRRALDVALLRAVAGTPVDARAVSTATYNVLRSLAARWLGWPIAAGQQFLLDTATVNVLSTYTDAPAIKRWNAPVNG